MQDNKETIVARPSSTERLRAWLKSDVTVTLPGWGVALGAAMTLALILVAVD